MLHRRIAAAVFAVGTLSFGCSEDSCFIGDTEVATPAGDRRIADLMIGDEVFSFDHERGELVVRKVRRIITSEVTTVCRVETSGGTVRGVTPSHPFFDRRTETYVALRDLKPDADLLRLGTSSIGPLTPARLERVEVEERPNPSFTVYNLEVEGPEHNYFADGVLVHNKSDPRPQDCENLNIGRDFQLEGDVLTHQFQFNQSGPFIDGPTATDLVGVSLEEIVVTTLEGEFPGASAEVILRVDESQLGQGSSELTIRATVDGFRDDPGACPISLRHVVQYSNGAIEELATSFAEN